MVLILKTNLIFCSFTSHFSSFRKKRSGTHTRHNAFSEAPLPLYIGLRLFKERKKGLIHMMNALQLCPSYHRLKTVVNQMGNLTIESFEEHGVAVGYEFCKNRFTTAAFDNLDHNPSSSTAFGSFHGSAITLTQHPDLSESHAQCVTYSSIQKTTPRVLKEIPSFYTNLTTDMADDQTHPPIPLLEANNGEQSQLLSVDNFCAAKMSLSVVDERKWLENVWDQYPDGLVTSWAAFHARSQMESNLPICKTSMLPLFNESSTDVNMVYHAMKIIMDSIAYLNPGQIPVMVCDQKIYAIAKQLQWTGAFPEIDEAAFFVHFGGLHFEKTVCQVIANVLQGSNWTKLLIEAGLFTPGVAEKFTTTVPHIKRCRHAHELLLAALNILKQRAFEDREDKSLQYEKWLEHRMNKSPLFVYWCLVMELQSNLLSLIRSLRSKNWIMYLWCLKNIAPWFFVTNHHLYARWVPVHIRDIEMHQKQDSGLTVEFSKGKFVAQKSLCRYSAIALDQNHEQCNKDVKGSGGAIGLFNQEPALRRWMTAHPMLSKTCKEFENDLLGNRSTSVFHHEETKTFQEKFDTDVKRLVEVIEDKLSIFSDDSGELFTLYTKHVADEEGVLQLRMLKENAIDIYQKLVKTVLIEKTTPFWDPIKQFKLDIFGLSRQSQQQPVASVSCLTKNASLLQKVFLSSVIRGKETLKTFFKHEMDYYPPSLSSNGEMRSTTKSSLLHIFESFCPPQKSTPSADSLIIDGPALVHMLAPRHDIKTFGEYIDSIIIPYLSSKKTFHRRIDIVFDVYNVHSTKTFTRKKRGCGQRIKVLETTAIPMKNKWQEFLRNDFNKSSLFSLISQKVTRSIKTKDVLIVATVNETAITNSICLDLEEVTPCNHEEADTRMLLHAKHCGGTVILKTVDTDVVVIAAACFTDTGLEKLWIEIGVGQHKRYIAIHHLVETDPLNAEVCSVLPFFHAATGCDTVSSLLGIGKKMAWKVFIKHLEYFTELFSPFSCMSSQAQLATIQHFFIALFSPIFEGNDIDECRYFMYSSGTPIQKLPPTKDSLILHAKRSVYTADCWKQSLVKQQVLPLRTQYGWKLSAKGELLVDWNTLPPASSLEKLIVRCGCCKICSKKCSCRSKQLKCTSLCACDHLKCNNENPETNSTTDDISADRNAFTFLMSL